MWVFEGITSYYQDLMLLRSHLIEPEAYLEGLGRLLTRVYRTPGRFRQSIAEASFDAWDKLYKPEANSSNATVSYYSKGALVALALDLTIRKESSTNLDRVMGELWKRFGKEGIGIGENEFEILSQEITGIDLVDFFELGVRGKKDLPLEELMSEFGIILEFHKAGSVDTSGLSRGEPEPAVDLGVQYRSHPQGLELTSIVDDGPGEHAALNSGDVLIAIDGFQVNGRSLAKRLARFEVGDTVSVTVFRDDELLEFQIMLAEVAKDNCVLSFDEEASVTALQRRKAWLGS
jgi:predicted metalloprotease with PDZ domain